MLVYKSFETKEEQDEWIAKEIIKNLTEDELTTRDIIVINPNPLSTRNNVGNIRRLLFQNGINSHIAGVGYSPDVFYLNDHESVTFTGINRAKGNEAGMVYVINAHECVCSEQSTFGANISMNRNRLFTAITRSKAWVRIVGVGDEMKALEKVLDLVKDNHFTLNFIYPTPEQIKYLNIVNRDMNDNERRNIVQHNQHLYDILDDLKNGKMHREDIPLEIIEQFLKIFQGNNNGGGTYCI